MSKYLQDQASSRDAIRQRLLGHRALPITDTPAAPVTSSQPIQTTTGLEGLLQQIAANLAPKGVAQTAGPELKVAPGGVSRASGGAAAQDSGLGAALGGLFGKGGGGGMQKAAENLAQANGRASLRDMATRGRKQPLTPQQQADANVSRARDLIPGLKPGVEAPKVEPGRASAEAYQTQQRKDIPPVVGVDKNAPKGEGYQADLKFLSDRGGHNSKLINGKIETVPLTEEGPYKPLNPEMAGRLAQAARDYEAATGKQANFGEFSRGEDVQKIYWDKFQAGTGGRAAPPGTSRHQEGNAGDIGRGPFHAWLDSNGDKYGVHFPIADDKVHVQLNPAYKGPSFAKPDTPPYGPGVVDTSKLPAWNKDVAPKYETTEPAGGWPDPTKFTDPRSIQMPEAPVTTPPPVPAAPGDSKVTPELMNAIEKIESNHDPSLVNKYGYKGLFQLSDSQYAKYGGAPGKILDPTENRRVAQLVIADEVKNLEQAIGRPVTPHEIYLAHQQGHAGAAAHLKNPDQPAWKSMLSTGEGQTKGEDWAKRAIWDNLTPAAKAKFGSVDNVKSSDFVQFWKEEGGRKGIKDAAPATAARAARRCRASSKCEGRRAADGRSGEAAGGSLPQVPAVARSARHQNDGSGGATPTRHG